MENKHENGLQTQFGGLDFETAKAMGLGRSKAIAVMRRKMAGKQLPNDPELYPNDFRCDAEQVSIDKHGKVKKSW